MIQEGFIIDDSLMSKLVDYTDDGVISFDTENFIWNYKKYTDKTWHSGGNGFISSEAYNRGNLDPNYAIGFYCGYD
jgi:hypothetical protein